MCRTRTRRCMGNGRASGCGNRGTEMTMTRLSELQRECAFDDLEDFVADCAREHLRPAFDGDPEAAISLSVCANPANAAFLAAEGYRLRIAPAALREVLPLPNIDIGCSGVIAFAGGRRQFAQLCRYAGVELPETLPDRVVIYRGDANVSHERAAAGMHWFTNFACAAFVGLRSSSSIGVPFVVQAESLRDDNDLLLQRPARE